MSIIAVVDDEKSIREVIRLALEKEFHEVSEYPDGLAAWEAFQRESDPPPELAAEPMTPSRKRVLGSPPELIILDILMPRMDGMELCKKIRTLPWGAAVPIIFLSSRDDEIDKVLGLESGADDYVCKPFSLRELTARIRAGLRRNQSRTAAAGSLSPAKVLSSNEAKVSPEVPLPSDLPASHGLLLDEARCFVSWKNRPLEMTVTEFRILQSLASRPGYIKTREQLMQAAFPEDNFPNDRAADSHVKRIRRKFLDLDPEFTSLEAVYGLGYRWQEPNAINRALVRDVPDKGVGE